MLFNSIEYLVYLPIVVILYFIIPHRHRWLLLLAASYFFYMCWNIKYSMLIFLSTTITFFSSILIYKSNSKRKKKLWMILSLVSNLGILFFFKYFNFTVNTLTGVALMFGINIQVPNFELLLPVGISFYTFQALSYTLDVYQGKLEPTSHFGKYALFVSFFPQLVAGPIERSKNLLHQFDEEHNFDYDMAKRGFLLIIWGVFKKVVIADRLAILVDTVFNNVGGYSGQAYWIASLFFTFQIYCDFSGYSDIAIGSANLMGYRLMTNFKRPYLSKSIAEFWRRWHISLSTWFKDYLYIPLGGNKVSVSKWRINIMVVFLVSGLWHGANWTFVIWGGLHGAFQIVGRLKNQFRPKKYNGNCKLNGLISILITFALVNFAWIIFRANSLEDFGTICKGLFVSMNDFDVFSLGLVKQDFYLSIILIAFLFISDIVSEKIDVYGLLQKQILPLRWIVYLISIFSIILFGFYGSLSEASFIYFQF
ncbi:MAG: MBOAT family protein [Firmicutes bacterium]|nr:MBOAT family protein [Bacillota bacterium]